MARQHRPVLSADEVGQFSEEGYVCLRAAFPRHLALECQDLAFNQLGIDEADPTSWRGPVVRGLVEGDATRRAANAPRLLAAVHQLLDPERWMERPNLGAFVVRFPSDVDPGDAGWHIDSSFQRQGGSDWYVNYRSRGRGLLLLCLLSDVGPDDAPTRILPGSHRLTPPLLWPFGEEGVAGLEAPLPPPTGPVVLATGEAGDVYLCHPFLVHAASWPHHGGAPRFVSQPPISLWSSLRIDDGDQPLSVVAQTVHDSLRGAHPLPPDLPG